MRKFITRILHDIAAGKNIEAYVVTAAALFIAVAGLFEDVIPIELKLSIILAALAILVLRSVGSEADAIDLDQVLRNRQDFKPFRDFLHGADELWLYGPSAVNVLRDAGDIKREVLDSGGRLRVLIQDPLKDASLEILDSQLDRLHDLRKDLDTSISTLENLTRMQMRGCKYF